MCCSNCGTIDPGLTIINGFNIHALGTISVLPLTLPAFIAGALNWQSPQPTFEGDMHEAEGKLIFACVFAKRQEHTVFRDVLDDWHDRSIEIVIKEGDPANDPVFPVQGTGNETARVYAGNPGPGGIVQTGQTITIVYDKMKVLEQAKATGVTYGEALAMVIVHELGHPAIPEPDDNHVSPGEQDTTGYYISHPLGVFERQVYKAVTGDSHHPRQRRAVFGGNPDPSNTVPACISNILSGYPDFVASMDSARSATYQYPTYNLHHELSGFTL